MDCTGSSKVIIDFKRKQVRCSWMNMNKGAGIPGFRHILTRA